MKLKPLAIYSVLLVAFGIGGFLVLRSAESADREEHIQVGIGTARDAQVAPFASTLANASDIDDIVSGAYTRPETLAVATNGVPVATAIFDQCRLETVEAGWTITAYEQRCYVVRYNGYRSLVSKAELDAIDPWIETAAPTELPETQDDRLLMRTGAGWDGELGPMIWTSETHEYWNEHLGCARFHLFCDSPRDEPLLGK